MLGKSTGRPSSATGRVVEAPGGRMAVVHPLQLARASRQALLRSFYATDIGVFLKAAGHERHRSAGCAQTIFIRCLAGAGWCEVEGIRHEVGSRDLLVIPANAPHAYGAAPQSPWSIEWFHAAGTAVPEILHELGISPRSPVVALRPGAWESAIFAEALSSLEAGFTDKHLRLAGLALGHLLGRLLIREKEGSGGDISREARLDRVAAFLRENPAAPLGVSGMAAMAGLSVSHFAVQFHRHTGQPPMEYLIRARIERACRLLDFTDLSIKEIAGEAGYSDPYYFSRVFKKITSRSPSAYRGTDKG